MHNARYKSMSCFVMQGRALHSKGNDIPKCYFLSSFFITKLFGKETDRLAQLTKWTTAYKNVEMAFQSEKVNISFECTLQCVHTWLPIDAIIEYVYAGEYVRV